MFCYLQQFTKCSECTYGNFEKCDLFLETRKWYYLNPLREFKRQKLEPFKSKYVWSTDEHIAKTGAATLSLALKRRVQVFTFNMMFDYITHFNEWADDCPDLNDAVVFLSVRKEDINMPSSTVPGSIVYQFIDKMQRHNIPVVLYKTALTVPTPAGMELLKKEV